MDEPVVFIFSISFRLIHYEIKLLALKSPMINVLLNPLQNADIIHSIKKAMLMNGML